MRHAQPKEEHPEQRTFSRLLYIIAAMGALAQYAESFGMVVAGCIILSISGFMVRALRVTARGTIYASHAEWLTRTFQIGSVFLFPGSIIVALYFVFKMTDAAAFIHVLANADTDDMGLLTDLVKNYITENAQKIDLIVTWSITPPIIWWVRRCWFGLWKAEKSEPIDFPGGIF